MKRKAIYCRTCYPDPADLEKQKQSLMEYSAEMGYTSPALYFEYGSGSTLDRPAFSELTIAIQNSDVDIVIMRDISRIARNHMLVNQWLAVVENAGVKLVTLDGSYPLHNFDFQSIIEPVR